MSDDRVCGACGHDPACGVASVTVGDRTIWLCHDDDHSCYVTNNMREHAEKLAKRLRLSE